MPTHVVWLRDVATEHVPLVGERLAMLGATLRLAAQAGVRVPDGFVITAEAFHAHLTAAQLDGELARFAERAPGERERIGRLLRARIRTEPLPEAVVGQVIAIYDRLVRT